MNDFRFAYDVMMTALTHRTSTHATSSERLMGTTTPSSAAAPPVAATNCSVGTGSRVESLVVAIGMFDLCYNKLHSSLLLFFFIVYISADRTVY